MNHASLNRYFRLVKCIVISLLLIPIPFVTAGETHKNDKVMATVNDEPIYESQISEGIPTNAFESTTKLAKEIKLERRISYLTFAQFLESQNIHVDNKEIDNEIEKLKKNPPASGCMCCRYPNLDVYMSSNFYTMAELRRETANGIGIARYLEKMWQQKNLLDADRKALVQKERTGLEKEYVKVSHIYFNTFQQPEFSLDSEGVVKKARIKAERAWQRLINGETFDKVAATVSDDTMNKMNGGLLGCIKIGTFGNMLRETRAQVKDGEYSKPQESPFGFHIVKFAPMNDADILDILKTQYYNQQTEKIISEIQAKAKVVKPVQE